MGIEKIFDDETQLLNLWKEGDEKSLKTLIERYQKYVYPAVLDMAIVGANDAYRMTVEIFDEAMRGLRDTHDSLLASLLRLTIEKCRSSKASTLPDWDGFMHMPDQQRASLRIIKEALNELIFEDRMVLILRDRLHLSYENIALIVNKPAKELHTRVAQARIQLRDKVTEALDKARKGL